MDWSIFNHVCIQVPVMTLIVNICTCIQYEIIYNLCCGFGVRDQETDIYIQARRHAEATEATASVDICGYNI